LVVSLLA